MRRLIHFRIGCVLLGLAATVPQARGDARPLPSCRDAWSSLVRTSGHRYDFQRDARITSIGNEGYESYRRRTNRSQCRKDWTVLVYMAADNDLTPYALWDVYEMEAAFRGNPSGAGSTLGNDLVVQLDAAGPGPIRRLHLFQSQEEYRLQSLEFFRGRSEADIRSPIAELLPDQGKRGEARRFSEFLEWGARQYPSDHYLVVVWGHGQGWKAGRPPRVEPRSRYLREADTELGIGGGGLQPLPGAGERGSRGGIAFNETTGDVLDIPSLRKALQRVSRAIGHPIDVYASDACLMQMLEVAYELSEGARFVVGSAQIQNFLGMPYRRLIYELNSGGFDRERASLRHSVDGGDEPYLLARMIPRLMRESMDPRRGSQGRVDPQGMSTITSSSISSLEMARYLVPSFSALSFSLQAYVQEDPLRALDLQFIAKKTPSFEGSAQDAGIFLGLLEVLLRREEEVKGGRTPAAAALWSAIIQAKSDLDRSVVNYAFGTSYAIDGNSRLIGFIPRAVSIWLPVSSEEYMERKKEFAASLFYRATGWGRWLDALFERPHSGAYE